MEKRIIKFILFVALASFFHSGAWVCLILLSAFFSNNLKRIFNSVLIVLTIFFSIFPYSALDLMLELIPTTSMVFAKLAFYASSEVYRPQLSVGIGAIPDFFLVITLLYLIYIYRYHPNISWISQGLIIFILFFVVIGRGMPVLTRLGWYGLPFVVILSATLFEGSKFLNDIKIKHIYILRGAMILWILSQMFRPFVYLHSAQNIFDQDLIFFRLNDLDDESLAFSAIERCRMLHFLGYSDLCVLE